jgi:hypothetical protein
MANAKKFLGQIDLNKIPIKNVVVEQATTNPSNPVEGQLYQNTTDHKLYKYNGTTWVAEGDAASIADGSVSNTEFQHLNGVTSAIQTQLNSKTTKVPLTFGNASDTTYTLTHNLNSFDVQVQIWLVSGHVQVEGFYVVAATENTITVEMDAAPGVNALRAVIIG